MKFRPCIDLHQGQVKQIVGSSYPDDGSGLQENFVSGQKASDFALLYAKDKLRGGHLIRLGPNNDEATKSALAAYPGGLQVGGGIQSDNAEEWIGLGAEKVILTSFIFERERLRKDRLEELALKCGPHKITLDLSCSKIDGHYRVMSNRWQTNTGIIVNPALFKNLAEYCSEFLIHAVDAEGKNLGPDKELLKILAQASERHLVYAGGIRNRTDLQILEEFGDGKIDFTVGSALDVFGGKGLSYRELVQDYS